MLKSIVVSIGMKKLEIAKVNWIIYADTVTTYSITNGWLRSTVQTVLNVQTVELINDRLSHLSVEGSHH